MPAIAAAPLFWGAVAGGGLSVAGSVIGGRSAANATKRAAQQQATEIDKQLAFEREQAAEDQRRWEETQKYNRDQAELQRQEDLRRYENSLAMERDRWATENRRWDAEQTRRAPYRATSVANMNQLAGQTAGASLADIARARR